MKSRTWVVAAVVGISVGWGCGGVGETAGVQGAAGGASIEELIEEIEALGAEDLERLDRRVERGPLMFASPWEARRDERAAELAEIAAALDAEEWAVAWRRALLMTRSVVPRNPPGSAAPVELVAQIRNELARRVERERQQELADVVAEIEMLYRSYGVGIEYALIGLESLGEAAPESMPTVEEFGAERLTLEAALEAAVESGDWADLAAENGLPADAARGVVLEAVRFEIAERNDVIRNVGAFVDQPAEALPRSPIK